MSREDSPGRVPAPPPADAAAGSFSEDPPWLVEPERMPWRDGIESLRRATRAQVPELTRHRRLPPGLRVAEVGSLLMKALAGWYLLDRRRGPEISRRSIAHRLRVAFETLGPTYIKLGQIISSGEGLFPPELVDEFRHCRDQVPPEDFSVVRRTVEEDLGCPIAETFQSFDPVPLAAASIAQVHAARLRSGENVVVKVQRPQVARLVRRDLAAMSWIAPYLIGRIPVTALANPPALVELFAETIVEELDFRLEGQNMLDVARVLAETDQRALVVPRPHPELVTRRVLVMERLDGFSWGDAEAMRAYGIDTEAVLKAGLIAFLEGTLLYGVFHGDLHGGNLLVMRDGRVALLDFGITGRLGDYERQAFLRLLISGTANDIRSQVEAMRDLGALPEDTDVDAVIRDLGLDRGPIDPTKMSAEELTAELSAVTKALLGYGARMPKELMLFVKDMLFLDGAIALMAPDLDLLGEIVSIFTYFQEHHGERIARDIGLEPGSEPAVDIAGIRAQLGVADPVDSLTYRDIAERRQIMRQRFEHSRRGRDAGKQ